MLQMFHLDVSKVDLGVAHVAVAICACFKCLICFRRMLQVFYLDDPKVDLEKAHAAACAPPWVTARVCCCCWRCCVHASA
jgi:hypothetical protein